VITLLFYSLIAGLFSVIGAAFLLWHRSFSPKLLTGLLSFAAGTFLSAVFFELLPEAVESVSEAHPIFMFALIGFTSFFVLERVSMRYLIDRSKHTHADHTESLPLLMILGDGIHNFIDGIVLALAYVTNPALALPTALAIATHEIPQEISEAAVFLKLGWKRNRILLLNILQSLLTIPGVFIGLWFGSSFESTLPYLLAIAAGIFLYISASDLIPEIHHSTGHKNVAIAVVPFVSAIIFMYVLLGLTH
jgi:zinc and cadmium transporter